MAGDFYARSHPGYSVEHGRILPSEKDVTMQNTSGFIPLGHRLLVLPDAIEEKTASGIVLARETTGRDEMAQVRGTLVAVGEGCWKDTTSSNWAEAGERIVYGKYSGLMWDGADGKKYRILNDLDVVGKEA